MPSKGLDSVSDAVEICGGSSFQRPLQQKGFAFARQLTSQEASATTCEILRLIEWIFHMLQSERFKAVLCEPVCTTFSPAQRPASRSYDHQPLGFDRSDLTLRPCSAT